MRKTLKLGLLAMFLLPVPTVISCVSGDLSEPTKLRIELNKISDINSIKSDIQFYNCLGQNNKKDDIVLAKHLGFDPGIWNLNPDYNLRFSLVDDFVITENNKVEQIQIKVELIQKDLKESKMINLIFDNNPPEYFLHIHGDLGEGLKFKTDTTTDDRGILFVAKNLELNVVTIASLATTDEENSTTNFVLPDNAKLASDKTKINTYQENNYIAKFIFMDLAQNTTIYTLEIKVVA